PKVWEASGHTTTFNDPLVTDTKTKKRYRADHVLEEQGIDPTGMSLEDMGKVIFEKGLTSAEGNPFSEPQQFNMMFKTSVGSVDGTDTSVYIRPETAQGMFVNFKNVIDSFHPKLPFGIAQIGKAFRNEIAPREFLFRVRELEIMEFEYFLAESEWQEAFELWRKESHLWFKELGFSADEIKEVEVEGTDRAHYSKRTLDFYFNYPNGYKEIGGIAYRTDFDLKNHIERSGVDLSYLDSETHEKFIPHVIEPTFGLGRHVLAVLASAYREDTLGGDVRTYLALVPKIAPVKAMVAPLLKNKPELVAKAREVRAELKKIHPAIAWDDNGNIGKRYRRQDEIGTPFCITIDFDTLGETPELKDTVTLRNRDTGEQERLTLSDVIKRIRLAIE
ncbi:MAG TPA: glycine--tRNA ligase, partial [Candidatus Paceibacterota bacterium]|nr:glycine--tRNA ligase [Candidatus Paceibacterota bacterium]